MKIELNERDKFLMGEEMPVSLRTEKIVKGEKELGIGDSRKWTKKRFQFISHCINFGLTFKEIGEMLNVTKQRVYAIYRYGYSEKNKFTGGVKKARKELDKYRCRICRKKLPSAKLHVHHIGSPKDNSTRNLVSLCAKCHIKIEDVKHLEGIKKSKELLKKKRWNKLKNKSSK